MLISAIARGLKYLQQTQLPTGTWLSWISSDQNQFSPHSPQYQINTTPALILHSLSKTRDHQPQLHKTIGQLAKPTTKFLLTQKSQLGTWNYWSQASPQRQTRPYPDDVDDTCLSLAALHQYQPQLVTGQTWAQLTAVLTQLEVKTGGPYKTWILADDADQHWQDVDLAVNNNIAYLLSLQQIKLPAITALTEQAITANQLESRYYPRPSSSLYFMSRWYQGSHLNPLQQLIWRQLESLTTQSDFSSLDLALIGNAWLHLPTDSSPPDKLSALINPLIKQLLASQQADGSWAAAGLWLDSNLDGQKHSAGSPSLTTALVIEYLGHYQHQIKSIQNPSTTPTLNSNLVPTISQQLLTQLEFLPTPLSTQAHTTLDSLLQLNHRQPFMLWSHHFNQGLNSEFETLPDSIITHIETANLWGWLAYTLYDQLYDQEIHHCTLALANIAHHQLLSAYFQLQLSPQFYSLLKYKMTLMDLANYQQLTQAQLKTNQRRLNLPPTWPSYTPLTTLAEKSIGQALGPVAVLFAHGCDRYHPAVQSWLEFCYHYLTVKQLHDDAHDWESDLKTGYLSPVVVMVLKAHQKPHQATNKNNNTSFAVSQEQLDQLDLKVRNSCNNQQQAGGQQVLFNSRTLTQLHQVYWTQTVPAIIRLSHHHLQTAHQALKHCRVLAQPDFFHRLLAALQHTTDDIAADHQQTQEFLDHYHHPR